MQTIHIEHQYKLIQTRIKVFCRYIFSVSKHESQVTVGLTFWKLPTKLTLLKYGVTGVCYPKWNVENVAIKNLT